MFYEYVCDDGAEKENNAFAVPAIPPRQRCSSITSGRACTVSNQRYERIEPDKITGGGSLRISPGTGASEKKMQKKLALLRKRDSERKRNALERKSRSQSSSRRSQIDLLKTAKKFLERSATPVLVALPFRVSTSTPSLKFGDAEEHRISATSDTKLSIGSISSTKNANSTFVVMKTPDVGSKTFTLPDVGMVTPATLSARESNHEYVRDTTYPTVLSQAAGSSEVSAAETLSLVQIEERQKAALSAWINSIIRQDFGFDSVDEAYFGNKIEAEQQLREMLLSKSCMHGWRKNTTTYIGPTLRRYRRQRFAEAYARAEEIFQSAEVVTKIARLVEDGRISVREDKLVYANLGLQTQILTWFLCLHPFWLYVGMSAVLGQQLAFPADCRIDPLVPLIIRRFLKDEEILRNRRYAKGRDGAIITPDGVKKFAQHFLTKFCQLLYVTDAVKSEKFFAAKTPCLFKNDSPFKSVDQMLAELDRELLTRSGSVVKTLAKVGFKPQYKQGFFDEYRFVVDTFEKDLANGIILGKVVEVIAGIERNAVISKLRNPGGDRLRKLKNLKIVFSAAAAHGIDIGGVRPESILQCKTRETLEAVWRLVGVYVVKSDGFESRIREESLRLCSMNTRTEFGAAPAFLSGSPLLVHLCRQLAEIFNYPIPKNILDLADGEILSLAWRMYNPLGTPLISFPEETLFGRIMHATEAEFGIPVGDLQIVEGTVEPKSLALFIQLFFEGLLKCYDVYLEATLKIQRGFRAYRLRRIVDCRVKEKERLRQSKKLNDAAVIIQAHLRGVLARRRFADIKRNFRRKCSAAVRIQRCYRKFLAWKRAELLREEERKQSAALAIQAWYRGVLARKLVDQLRAWSEQRSRAAILIQRYYRGFLARRYVDLLREKKNREESAASLIQAWFRGILARRLARKLHTLDEKRNQAAVLIQRCCRGFLARKRANLLREEQDRKQSAALTIQTWYRGMLARKLMNRLRAWSERRSHAAVLIQRYYREFLKRKHAKLLLLEEYRRQSAALSIQAWYRSLLSRRLAKELRHLKEQRSYTAVLAEHDEATSSAAGDLFRKKDYVQEFLLLRQRNRQMWFELSRIREQLDKYVRFSSSKLREEQNFEHIRNKAATVIQASFRGYRSRRQSRAEIESLARWKNEFRKKDNANAAERARPALHRVVDAVHDLLSDNLKVRCRAAETLYRLTSISHECALYVFDNAGLQYVLDALDSSNRGYHEMVVVEFLCGLLLNILEQNAVRAEISPKEDVMADLVKSVFHYFNAFHSSAVAAERLGQCLLHITAIDQSLHEFKSAPFYLREATRRFARLQPDDRRSVILGQLKAAYNYKE